MKNSIFILSILFCCNLFCGCSESDESDSDNFLRNSFPLFRKLDRQEVPQLFQEFIFLKQQLIMRYLLTEYKRKLSMQPRIV